VIDISVVIPSKDEEENVIPLYKELKEVLNSIGKEYEIIFIDDGSVDRTYKNLKSIEDDRVKIIKFRKSFGKASGLDAGFKMARGNIFITLDSDLQDDPADIPKLMEKLNKGYDAVSGWRKYRRDTFFKRFISRGANVLRKIIFKDKIHDSGCGLKIYKRECLEGLNLYGEMHRFIFALLLIRGFKVGETIVNHRPRKYGQTKYNIGRIYRSFLDMILVKFYMQYSATPMHLFGGIGLMISIIGLVITSALSIYKLIHYTTFSLMNRPVWLLSILMIIIGIQFIVFGVTQDSITKSYYHKEKPYYIEKNE